MQENYIEVLQSEFFLIVIQEETCRDWNKTGAINRAA